MTNEVIDVLRKTCVFVPNWKCPIETPEIPLEVCKLCLEARKIQSKQTKISRQVESVELSPNTQAMANIDTEAPQVIFEANRSGCPQ
jgi:hypothetical protein